MLFPIFNFVEFTKYPTDRVVETPAAFFDKKAINILSEYFLCNVCIISIAVHSHVMC